MIMELAWLGNTRPDTVFEISQVERVTQVMYYENIMKHSKPLKNATKYVHDHKESIFIPKLNYSSLQITSYSDPELTNNADLYSQLSRIFFLTDDNHHSVAVSYKSLHVTRFALSAEVIAFGDFFDDELSILNQLEFILRQPIPVHILTDSQNLFSDISKRIRASEKRILLDTYAARQANKAQ